MHKTQNTKQTNKATNKRMGKCSLLFVLAPVVMCVSIGYSEGGLAYDYYKYTCPDMENIVKQELLSIFITDPSSPAAFLRLMFHDCQVQGCDASILLDSNGYSIKSEIVSSKNFGIKKREMISRIKSALEMVCPGEVSCADIIALAAKESVSFSGGPDIQIPLGRKDSRFCSNKQADLHLPSRTINVNGLLYMFMSKGMNLQESVAILGAHTLGVGHCINVVDRLLSDRKPENWMELGFQGQLRLNCPIESPLENLTVVPNDITPMTFDNQYYRDVLVGRGLFRIDSSISKDYRTEPIVRKFALDQEYFFRVFSSAFVKLPSTNALTGWKGEVRRQCDRVN